jgi:ribosomal protein L11
MLDQDQGVENVAAEVVDQAGEAVLTPEQALEQQLRDLMDEDGLPKYVSIDYVKSKIADVTAFTAPGTNFVICYVKMKSGATEVGEANFTDVAAFDERQGHEQAFQDALRKLIQKEIYALAERRYALSQEVATAESVISPAALNEIANA